MKVDGNNGEQSESTSWRSSEATTIGRATSPEMQAEICTGAGNAGAVGGGSGRKSSITSDKADANVTSTYSPFLLTFEPDLKLYS